MFSKEPFDSELGLLTVPSDVGFKGAWCNKVFGEEMKLQPLLVLSLLFFSLIAAPNSYLPTVKASGECCGSQAIDLFLTGTNSLSPFDSDKNELHSKSLTSSIPNEETIGAWSFQPGYHGDINSEEWTFSITYEVENAAGVQLNATVKINIGPNQFTGETPAGDTYVPGGSGILTTSIQVDAGTLVSSDIVSVELVMSSLVFVVPGSDAKIDFLWGDEDHESKLEANLPLMDIDISEPIIDGRTLHIPAIIRSGFSQKLIEEGTITCSVNGELLSGEPVKTPSGQDVKATWSWSAGESFSGDSVEIEINYVMQSGGSSWLASGQFEVQLEDGDGSGTYYGSEEPIRTNNSNGLSVIIDADLDEGDGIVIKRVTRLVIKDDMAYWMRWGITNQNSESLKVDSVWKRFDGGFSESQYEDGIIDNSELERFASRLQSQELTLNFLENALQLESEPLLGGSFRDFHTLEVRIDLNDDNTVNRNQVTLIISTTQSIKEGDYFDLLQQFILPQSESYWNQVTLDISLHSDSQSSFTDIHEKTSEDLETSHERHITEEVYTVHADNILSWNKLDLRVKTSTNPLYSPLPLAFICLSVIAILFSTCLLLARGKDKKPLILETILIPLVAAAYWYAFPMEGIGALMGGIGGIWMVTTIITPKRLGEDGMPDTSSMPEVPTISCPKCTTVNPVVSDIRPLRLPCGGCGRVLKIVA